MFDYLPGAVGSPTITVFFTKVVLALLKDAEYYFVFNLSSDTIEKRRKTFWTGFYRPDIG